jgi:hypothetical protein
LFEFQRVWVIQNIQILLLLLCGSSFLYCNIFIFESTDFEHEVKCLRKWLREMEARLQPLNFRVDWSKIEIEEKAVEHMVRHFKEFY